MKKVILGLISGIVIVLALVIFSNLRANNAPTSNISATSQISTTTVPALGQLPLQSEYHVNLPNGIMLVDSQGRRTGKNPATGIRYHEIPGTAYGEDCLSKTNCAGELFTNNLPEGQYTFYVLGGVAGTYGLSVYNNRGLSQVFKGDIQLGAMIEYTQKYDALNFASSSLVFAGTVSSTANITTAPPHNVP